MNEGADPFADLRAAVGRLDGKDAPELDRPLDDVGHLCQVMDPDQQHLAEAVADAGDVRLATLARA